MNVKRIEILWVSGYVRCATTINHRITDPTTRTIVLNCLFLIPSPISRAFLSKGALRVHRAAGDGLFKLWFEAITLNLLWHLRL